MSSSLPPLALHDFDIGSDHVAEAVLNDKVFLILHKDDPARVFAPALQFESDDPYTYVVIHGGDEESRFQNLATNATHEIPAAVAAALLARHYGSSLAGTPLRVCACYGTLLRPGDQASAAQSLARELPQSSLEGYHGLVILDLQPVRIRLGMSIQWDAQHGPVIVGPPGDWEPVTS